ncbi:MAG: amidohydrolase family protein, partial [Chloroflexota bacterium]
CIGDAAVDLTLDAFEEAQNANPRPDPRHRIEHAILTTPQATRRMKDLGVVMSANPQFIFLFGDGYERLFSKSIDRIMVMREWLESVHLTIGSDAPSMPWYTPQATIAGAMSRITYSKKVIGADQTLKFEEALRAHTIGAAYADHDETVKGSLEVGKFADIAVWSQDPTKASIEELFKMAPMYMTLVGGKVVHQG